MGDCALHELPFAAARPPGRLETTVCRQARMGRGPYIRQDTLADALQGQAKQSGGRLRAVAGQCGAGLGEQRKRTCAFARRPAAATLSPLCLCLANCWSASIGLVDAATSERSLVGG